MLVEKLCVTRGSLVHEQARNRCKTPVTLSGPYCAGETAAKPDTVRFASPPAPLVATLLQTLE